MFTVAHRSIPTGEIYTYVYSKDPPMHFPVLKDTLAVDVWGMLNGKKDDIIIVDSFGFVAELFSVSNGTLTVFADPGDKAKVKAALDEVL